MARPRVTLTMIVRDEAHQLAACLGPVAGVFDEVVVADTGSRDDTRAVAAAHGAVVLDVPWADSFAAARNAALGRATGRWAFRLDADDRVDPAAARHLAAVLAGLPDAPARYAVRYVHEGMPGRPDYELAEVRLFPRAPGVRWEYRVHEQVAGVGGPVVPTGVAVRHVGYADPAGVRRKLERNLRLVLRDAAERPGDPAVGLHAGGTLLGLGRPAEAVGWLERAVRDAPAGVPLRARCHARLGVALAGAGRPGPALAAVRSGRAEFPADAELAYREGELLARAGDPAGAADRFRFLLSGAAAEDDRSAVPGLCGWAARAGLAAALGPDRNAERERLWRDVLADRPGHVPALFGLGRLYAGSSRWGDLEGVLADLDRFAPGGPDAAVLRARWRAERGDVRGAAKLLRTTAERHPADTRVWLELGRVLALEGSDRAGAEVALRRVLATDPGNPDAARLLRLVTGRR